MKPYFIFLAVAMLLFPAFHYVSGVLDDLGTTMEEVKRVTLQQLDQDDFSTPYYTQEIKKACQKLPVGVRDATIMSLGKIIKDYVNSPECKSDFEKLLQERYLQDPYNANDPRWKEIRQSKLEELNQTMSIMNDELMAYYGQMLDGEIQGQETIMKLMEQNPGYEVPGFSKEGARKTISEDKMLKDLFNQDKAAFKKKYAEIMADREMNQKMAEAKKEYADNVAVAARKRDFKLTLKMQLQGFLNRSADVNYEAKLVNGPNGRKVFADPDFESKPGEWKFYYRCGEEAVKAARRFAQQWLNEID